MRHSGSRRKLASVHVFLLGCAIVAGVGLLILTLRSVDPSASIDIPIKRTEGSTSFGSGVSSEIQSERNEGSTSCATVEEMGEVFGGEFWKESLRVRKMVQDHFAFHGASRVRGLPPEQFCRHGFVLGKASEAGFGNEMYKILTAAALSIMLNRSLIIGQTRGKYPFGDYISYTNQSFTLREIKHLWRQNDCVGKYGRHLVVRIDNFQKPAQTSALCSNWREWEQPIIWFQGTTDAVAAQFFLKNIHPGMRNAAADLFGLPEYLQSRPNVFGEFMRVLISPSEDVQEAINWVLKGGLDPDISLHMRMLMNRSVRAAQAALHCIRKAMRNLHQVSRPRVALVSDTPSLIKEITPNVNEFAEILHFDYELFKGNRSGLNGLHNLDFRVKDWGPAPRWVAFVDFFLASRAKYAVVSGAHRRVGTTYAQLIAALAAAHKLGDNSSTYSSFSFFSSFHGNLLSEGLGNQVGWGHVWNRFAGPLSCHNQSSQCALTPVLPPAWWDGLWQSPIPRDIRRLEAYGVQLSGFGTFDENHLRSFCNSRKNSVITMPISQMLSWCGDPTPDKEPLDWNTRMTIAAGAAKGLNYLHNVADPPVIYRDFKSSNILLGEGFNPKLSDFGLAKFGPSGDRSYVSTRVMGTHGYCAPEYATSGRLTVKSDIYSFGVVFLELITGRRALDPTRGHGKHQLVDWASQFVEIYLLSRLSWERMPNSCSEVLPVVTALATWDTHARGSDHL